MPNITFSFRIVLFLIILAHGSPVMFRRRPSTYYNTGHGYHGCPPGYALHYPTKICVWAGPQPVWHDGVDEMFPPPSGGGSGGNEDHKCPDGYKFSTPLRLCLLPHFCNYCKTGSSVAENGPAETVTVVMENKTNANNAEPFSANLSKCLCDA